MVSTNTASVPSTALQAGHLDEVQAFVAVAQSGGFSAAAVHLGKDASTVSRRIAALERRLGVRLITRTTRRLAITEAGTNYLARMSAVLEEMASADAEIAARGERPQGLLRLALPRTYGRLWITPLLPRFMARFPDVQIDARFSDHFVDLVGEGFDVAIRLGALRNSTLVARKVGDVQRRLYASRTYLRAHGTPAAPKDLLLHRCLGFAGYEHGADWVLRKARQRLSMRVPLALHSDDADSLVTAAADGAGIVIATDWLVAKHAARSRLCPVLPAWDVGEPGAIYIVTPSARFLPAKTRVFIDMVTQALRNGHG
jgi:DNA-binding transcriptional LysR family regulator